MTGGPSRARLGVVVALSTAVLVLSSCSGGDGGGTVLPSPTPTTVAPPPSTEPLATTTPPPMVDPKEAAKQEAFDFVQRYYDAFNRAQATSDGAELSSLMAQSCACRKVLGTLEQLRAQGRFIQGGAAYFSTNKEESQAASTNSVSIVGVERGEEGSVVDATGKKVDDLTIPPPSKLAYTMIKTGDVWQVGSVLDLGPVQ